MKIREIEDFLVEADEKKYLGDRIWTTRLKERIGDLGQREFGYCVATAGFRDKFEIEWLYDVVWYVADEKGRLIKIPLIVESEWDRSIQVLSTILRSC